MGAKQRVRGRTGEETQNKRPEKEQEEDLRRWRILRRAKQIKGTVRKKKSMWRKPPYSPENLNNLNKLLEVNTLLLLYFLNAIKMGK